MVKGKPRQDALIAVLIEAQQKLGVARTPAAIAEQADYVRRRMKELTGETERFEQVGLPELHQEDGGEQR